MISACASIRLIELCFDVVRMLKEYNLPIMVGGVFLYGMMLQLSRFIRLSSVGY